MGKIRVGIIGVGIMGSRHLQMLEELNERFQVTALCDIDESNLAAWSSKNYTCYTNYKDLVDSGLCDAVVVATPHPCHAEISIYALEHGIHCMCEKPLSETVQKTDELIAAARKSGKLFCTNFSMRTRAHVKEVRRRLLNGELGDILRVDCVCTRWLRSQAYFDGQAWRGKWNGEGGGILMNQTPHNLDLLYHWFGEMKSVKADLAIRMHDIEVEDEVNAVIQTKAGFPIRFYANTGEAPGIDRVEIVGDKAMLISEITSAGCRLEVRKLNKSISAMLAGNVGCPEAEVSIESVPIDSKAGGAKDIWLNFANAIENGETLLAPGYEGIHAVELANAMTLSHFTGSEISIPVDRNAYNDLLKDLQADKLNLR